MATLFVYGSLMAEEVLQVLLGRVPQSAPATLAGYLRHSIQGVQYPIITKTTQTNAVKGKLLYGINSQELYILDVFEGDEYLRTDIIAETNDGSQVNAATYVATKETHEKFTPQLSHEWSFEHFREKHMTSFLDMCKTFSTELKEKNSATRISL